MVSLKRTTLRLARVPSCSAFWRCSQSSMSRIIFTGNSQSMQDVLLAAV